MGPDGWMDGSIDLTICSSQLFINKRHIWTINKYILENLLKCPYYGFLKITFQMF